MSLEKIENLVPRDRIIVCLYLMHNLDKKTEFLEKSGLLREMEEIVPNLFKGINFNYYLSALIQKEGMVKEIRFGSRGHKTYTLTKKARKRINENTELSQIVQGVIDKEKSKETVADENNEEKTNIGYFAQEHEILNLDKNILEDTESGNNDPFGSQEINGKEIGYSDSYGDLDDNFNKYTEGLKVKKISNKKKEKTEREPGKKKLNSIQIYFEEAREKKLSPKETLGLFMQIETGGYKERLLLADDEEAENNILSIRRKIVEGNLLLATWWGWRHIHFTKYSNFEFLDLIQLCNIGLMKAAERFNIYRGYRFSTYAVWWMDQHLHRKFIDEGQTIRKPVYIKERFIKMSKIERQFIEKFEKCLSIEEMSEITKLSVQETKYVKEIFFKEPLSLDAPVFDKDGKEKKFVDFIPCLNIKCPEKIFGDSELEKKFNDVLNMLSEKEKQIVEFRFKDGLSLEETGERLNLSRERIRQIEEIILKKLRRPSVLEKLVKLYSADIDILELIKKFDFDFNRTFKKNISYDYNDSLNNTAGIKQKKKVNISLRKAARIRRQILKERLELKNK